MQKRIYTSMSSYMAGRLLGIRRGTFELNRMLQELAQGDSKRTRHITVQGEERIVDDCWVPALRSINSLRHLAELELRLDCGATSIAKSRSRHFTAAFESECSAWLTIDDDVEVSIESLAWLLTAIEWDNPGASPRVCIVPCLLREQGVANVEWSPIYSVRRVDHPKYPHGQVRAAARGGFGCVAMNRAAIEAIANAAGREWLDNDGTLKFAPFREKWEAGGNLGGLGCKWHGEDVSFFERLPARVQVEALSIGESLHAGYGLDFGELG